MIQRHMELYPKNDQSQLKNIFNQAASINVNGTNISPEELADFERMHHKIFENIKFQVGANITSKYENGQIWTHVWAWWSAEGKKSKDFNLYAMSGDKVITVSPVTRAATQLLVTTLAHQVRAIATGAVDLGPKVNKVRQQDMIFDMMKVLMLEQKRAGFMAGNNLRAMKNFEIGQVVSARMKQGLDNLAEENEKYFTYLAGIRKTHGDAVADQLHELHMLSDGVVQRLEHIHKFLEARTTLTVSYTHLTLPTNREV